MFWHKTPSNSPTGERNLSMNKSNLILTTAAIAVITIAIAVYYSVNPEGVWWFPKCKLYQFTGLKCPICGLQRAIHQFLNGNFLAAFQYNWFLPFSAIYWGIVLLVRRTNLTPLFYFYCLLAVVWMVIRNILGL